MRKVLANLVYIVLGLPLALSALLLLSVRPWALDRDFYRRAVEDDRLYAAIAAAGADAGEEARIVRRGGATYDGPALSAAIRKNLPVAELKSLGLRAVNQALDLVEGADRDGRFDLDLKPLKAAVKARAPALARDYAAALPVRPELPAPKDFSFRPASLSPKQAEARAVEAIGETLAAMPDAVSAPLDIGARSYVTKALLDRTAAGLAAFSALFLAGLAALGGTGIAGRIAKAGRYILPPSIAVLALGAILALPGAAFLERLLPPEARALIAGPAAGALKAYVASVLGAVSRGFFVTGLVGTSLGGLLAQARRIAEPKEIE